MARLGNLYVKGEGVPRGPKRAFELFRQCAAKGDKNGQFYLAVSQSFLTL